MIDTQVFRDKYAQRENSRGIMFTPIGGKDVIRLCEAVERLVLLVWDLQAEADDDVAVSIEHRLLKV